MSNTCTYRCHACKCSCRGTGSHSCENCNTCKSSDTHERKPS